MRKQKFRGIDEDIQSHNQWEEVLDLVHEPPLQSSVYPLLLQTSYCISHLARGRILLFLRHRLVLLWPKLQRSEALVGSTLL